jgi:hypothetical protein
LVVGARALGVERDVALPVTLGRSGGDRRRTQRAGER